MTAGIWFSFKHLVVRSGFFPRVLGYLLAVACVSAAGVAAAAAVLVDPLSPAAFAGVLALIIFR